MSRTTNDLAQVRLLFGFGALNVIDTVFAYVLALATTWASPAKLTLVTVVYPPLMVLTRSFSRRTSKSTREVQDALGMMSDRAQANFAGVRVVRSFALQQEESKAFEAVNEHYLEKSLDIARVRGSIGPLWACSPPWARWSCSGTAAASSCRASSPGAFVAFLERPRPPRVADHGARVHALHRPARARVVHAARRGVRGGALGGLRTRRRLVNVAGALAWVSQLRLRRPRGALARLVLGRGRQVARHRRAHGLRQDHPRLAAAAASPRAPHIFWTGSTPAPSPSPRCASDWLRPAGQLSFSTTVARNVGFPSTTPHSPRLGSRRSAARRAGASRS